MTRPLMASTAALVLALSTGCAARAPARRWYQPAPAPSARPPTTPPIQPATTAPVPPAPAPQAPSLCGVEIDGLDAVLRPGALILFGDPAGNNEVPAFLEVAACHAAEAGHGVILALEIPTPEQPLLDAFVESAGAPADRAALLAGRFWNRPYQDGRSSRAVYQLIDRLRALRTLVPTRVVGIDQPAFQGNERDAFMARQLRKARESVPGAITLVLTGNVHARTVKGVPWDREFMPLGWQLEQAGETVLSLDASYPKGQAWVCNLMPDPVCGPRELPRPRHKVRLPLSDLPRVEKLGVRSLEGYDGIFYVGELSASGPARMFY